MIIAMRKKGAEARRTRMGQCQKPHGWRGKMVLWLMNRRHSALTDWGLTHVPIAKTDVILDVGCGGGRTVAKLAALASSGRVTGIDYSEAAVAAARKLNQPLIVAGRVNIGQASVSELPVPNSEFDLVTAVETHFWWPDLAAGMREIFRVLEHGGRVLLVAEIYNGGRHAKYIDALSRYTTMKLLTIAEHESLLMDAGFTDVRVDEDRAKGWICATGMKA